MLAVDMESSRKPSFMIDDILFSARNPLGRRFLNVSCHQPKKNELQTTFTKGVFASAAPNPYTIPSHRRTAQDNVRHTTPNSPTPSDNSSNEDDGDDETDVRTDSPVSHRGADVPGDVLDLSKAENNPSNGHANPNVASLSAAAGSRRLEIPVLRHPSLMTSPQAGFPSAGLPQGIPPAFLENWGYIPSFMAKLQTLHRLTQADGSLGPPPPATSAAVLAAASQRHDHVTRPQQQPQAAGSCLVRPVFWPPPPPPPPGPPGGGRCVCGSPACTAPHHTMDTQCPEPGLAWPASSACSLPVPLPVYVRTRGGGGDLAGAGGMDGGGKAKKCRRSRTVFTELQLMGLERRFEEQKYLSTPDRLELADTLGLSQLQVKTWYQNRRMKWKKQVMQGGGTEPPTKPKGRPRKYPPPPHDVPGGDAASLVECDIMSECSDVISDADVDVDDDEELEVN